MINFLIATAVLLAVVVIGGWRWIWPWLKTHGVHAGSQMILFLTAEENPSHAVHMTLYGVEHGNWFAGVMRSVTLVKQQVQPAPVKLVLPE